jgi:segregation and condensation protein A
LDVGGYRVQLELFEGPLDLLLHLIKKSEVDITDIPVASITEQYLGYLDLMRELNLDVAGEFLVMAATLMLVKSRMLLPAPEGEEDEEDDPRADLVRQLLEYSRYRDSAFELGERPRLNRDTFVRMRNAEGIEPDPNLPPHLKVTLWELMAAFQKVLKRSQPDPVHEIANDPVRVRDRIDGILRTLSVARKVTFESLFDESSSRSFVIVTFLALLELGKLGAIDALQEEPMGEILIVLAVDDVGDVHVDLDDEYEGGSVLPRMEEPAADDGATGA